MKRLDEGRVSLVEFLRSIQRTRHSDSKSQNEYPAQFADFNPRARTGSTFNAEDLHLVRSAN